MLNAVCHWLSLQLNSDQLWFHCTHCWFRLSSVGNLAYVYSNKRCSNSCKCHTDTFSSFLMCPVLVDEPCPFSLWYCLQTDDLFKYSKSQQLGLPAKLSSSQWPNCKIWTKHWLVSNEKLNFVFVLFFSQWNKKNKTKKSICLEQNFSTLMLPHSWVDCVPYQSLGVAGSKLFQLPTVVRD